MGRSTALSLLVFAVLSTTCQADTIYSDLSSFLAATGPNSVATFDDVPAGTTEPFTSGGATFTNSGGTVLNSLVGLDHSFWFGSQGSSPNFFGTITDYNVSLPATETAFGVLMACFGCDPMPNESLISWTLFSGPSGTGSIVDSGSQLVDLSPDSEGNPTFLGVVSPVSFESLAVTKTEVASGQPGGTYVIDDFRYATSVPEPSSALATVVAVVVLGWIRKWRTPNI